MSQRSLDMNRLHFSLWAITSAPLILGMHPESMPDELIAVVTNKEAIAINQLYAGSIVQIRSSIWNSEDLYFWSCLVDGTKPRPSTQSPPYTKV